MTISFSLGSILTSAHAKGEIIGDNFYFFPLLFFPTSQNDCQLNSQEQEFAELMQNDLEQQRLFMNCDPILAKVARSHAKDMAERNYFGHVTPEGYGPNYRVWYAGYLHPYSIDLTANNIESLHGGGSTASRVWESFMTSDGHRNHLLGLLSCYAEQTDYGIGYAYNSESKYQHFWVIITAYK